MDGFLSELAKSGPWALVAGFLLWTLVRERQSFQAQVLVVLGEFKDAINANTTALISLTRSLDDDSRHHAGTK